jgi:glycosyltransferase involved in cell wall biosynthesis
MLSAAKPRICIVNPFEHGGGAEYQIEQLIDALARSDEYEIHYLTHFVDERARNRTYHVSRIGSGGPIPRFGYLMEARSLYRKLRDIDPCIIYQRVACAYTGICAFYSRRHATPLLWHVAHDTEVTPQLLDRARNMVRLRLEKWAVESGAKHATRIVVQTRHQAHLLQKNYGRAADAVVANFHPPAAETIDKSGPLTVIWIANLKPWKQPEVFVRLANSLSSCSEVRFVIVGAPAATSGNQRWQLALMQGIQNAPNLQYLGQKSHTEVNELLARAHIFVNTSVHEGFPNTFIQAWLRDVVVVSLQVDPDHSLERRGVGIVAHSESGLVAAVRGLIDNPDVRAAYLERGRVHAIEHHSLRNADELVGLLRAYRREPSR